MRDTIIAIVVTLTVIILIGLDFISQYQIQSQQDNFKCSQYVWPYSFYVGVQLNIPIFNGFKNGYKAKQSTIALQELQNAAERLNSKVLLEYRKAGRDYKEAIAKVKIQQDVLHAAESSLSFINGRYQKGMNRYQDVLDAQLIVMQAKNNYNKAAYDVYVALFEKNMALGNL